jgi:hypothetical protein
MQNMGYGEELWNKYGQGADQIKPAINDIMTRYQSRLAGYDSPQLAAQRAEQSQMINSQMLAGQRQLRAQQAAQGVRGAAALAGQQNLVDQAINARAQGENALLARQFDVQRGALQDYDKAVTSERFGALSTAGGFADMIQRAKADEEYRKLLAQYLGTLQGDVDGAGSSGGKPGNEMVNKILSPATRFEEQMVPGYFKGNTATRPFFQPTTASEEILRTGRLPYIG